jgi:hypothetical protein
MSPTGALIERREYKYLIDEATAAGVRQALAPFCKLDPYAERQVAQRYTIDSLYFDTPTFALFGANEVELLDRFKLRVRHYPQYPEGPVFFETKRRVNDVISKARGRVPRDTWVELLAHPGPHLPDVVRPRDRAAVERFLALVHTYHAAPVTLVRYEREPWVSVVDDYARVTFDRHVRSQRVQSLSLSADPRGWRAQDHAVLQKSAASMTILELKFTTAVPVWMVHIVKRFDLSRRAFSKYATSVQAWYGAASAARTVWAGGPR